MLKDPSKIRSLRKPCWRTAGRLEAQRDLLEDGWKVQVRGVGKDYVEGGREVKCRVGGCEARSTTTELTG